MDMKSTKKHLDELRKLAGQISVANGAMIVGQMIPHFAAFLEEWAERGERLQKWIRGFTIALFVLTVALVGLTWRLARYGQQNDYSLNMKLLLQWFALFCEGIGTAAVFLDAKRINARLLKDRLIAGDPEEYRAWFYRQGLWGLGLLLAGIVLQGIVLALEHAA
jgi:hypothetical protein